MMLTLTLNVFFLLCGEEVLCFVDFRSWSVVPDGIKLNGLTDTMYQQWYIIQCNLAIQSREGLFVTRWKIILLDSVHFVCSLTVSTLFVDEQSLLALSFNKICVNHKKCAKWSLLINARAVIQFDIFSINEEYDSCKTWNPWIDTLPSLWVWPSE